jgi:polar amino acid transport system substrate-binding protein
MLRRLPAIFVLLVASCGLPRDPEGTSERIASTHQLRAGVTDNSPWVNAQSAEPQGIEPDLVRAFAHRLGARIIWTRGSETSLAKSLEQHELDLAIGGFESKTPWRRIAGVSQPFAWTADGKQHVMLAPPGENRFLLTLDAFLSEHPSAPKGALS